MNPRLVHDVAFLTAVKLLEVVGLCLPPEHLKAIFDEFYRVVKAGVETFSIGEDKEKLGPRGRKKERSDNGIEMEGVNHA